MMAGLHIRWRVEVVNISEAVQEADSILAMAVSSDYDCHPLTA